MRAESRARQVTELGGCSEQTKKKITFRTLMGLVTETANLCNFNDELRLERFCLLQILEDY